MIFSCLGAKDVKSVRNVCRIFCHYASQYLVDTVYVGSQTKTLDRSNNRIAKHPVFRQTVRTIVYSTCSLDYYATPEEYIEDVWERTRYLEHRRPTKDQCRRYWRQHQELYEDQVETLQRGHERCIKYALRRMPNIEHLVFSGTAWQSLAHPLNGYWCTWNDDFIITPNSRPVDDESCQISHGFDVMCTAFSANRRMLRSLLQAEQPTCDYLRPSCFSEKVQEVFGSIHEVFLYFDDQCLEWQPLVESCLFIAKELQSLHLSVEKLPDGIVFANIFFNTWPNLSCLSLTLDIEYNSFLAFCQKHQGTLRILRLSQCCLFQGTWENLVGELNGCLHLSEALLEGVAEASHYGYEWQSGARLSEAEEYLLSGGQNPFANGTLKLERID